MGYTITYWYIDIVFKKYYLNLFPWGRITPYHMMAIYVEFLNIIIIEMIKTTRPFICDSLLRLCMIPSPVPHHHALTLNPPQNRYHLIFPTLGLAIRYYPTQLIICLLHLRISAHLMTVSVLHLLRKCGMSSVSPERWSPLSFFCRSVYSHDLIYFEALKFITHLLSEISSRPFWKLIWSWTDLIALYSSAK